MGPVPGTALVGDVERVVRLAGVDALPAGGSFLLPALLLPDVEAAAQASGWFLAYRRGVPR